MFFVVLLLISSTSACGPNFLSYGVARIKAKRNFDHAMLGAYKQHLHKMQAVFDEKINPELADAEQIRLHPVEPRNDRPRCQQCPILNPIGLAWNCPIFVKELTCQPYVIQYNGVECLTANVTCLQPHPPDSPLATYLGVVAYDLNNKKRAVHILQYGLDNGLEDIENFDMENYHPGRGFKAHLLCNDYRRWTVYANDRKYDVDSLFCLTLHIDQLENVRELFPKR